MVEWIRRWSAGSSPAGFIFELRSVQPTFNCGMRTSVFDSQAGPWPNGGVGLRKIIPLQGSRTPWVPHSRGPALQGSRTPEVPHARGPPPGRMNSASGCMNSASGCMNWSLRVHEFSLRVHELSLRVHELRPPGA